MARNCSRYGKTVPKGVLVPRLVSPVVGGILGIYALMCAIRLLFAITADLTPVITLAVALVMAVGAFGVFQTGAEMTGWF